MPNDDDKTVLDRWRANLTLDQSETSRRHRQIKQIQHMLLFVRVAADEVARGTVVGKVVSEAVERPLRSTINRSTGEGEAEESKDRKTLIHLRQSLYFCKDLLRRSKRTQEARIVVTSEFNARIDIERLMGQVLVLPRAAD